ncbi:MAG: VapC toxin family PIN domain ribonuclease, partial [Gemmatimonadota bacterium]|nr:VapC toxin family PIN domain ribonuclease [Gemmatimonadota bacterium]
EIFQKVASGADARGNLAQDAYFAALAIESGCEWITTDRDYARFPGLRWRHPLQAS